MNARYKMTFKNLKIRFLMEPLVWLIVLHLQAAKAKQRNIGTALVFRRKIFLENVVLSEKKLICSKSDSSVLARSARKHKKGIFCYQARRGLFCSLEISQLGLGKTLQFKHFFFQMIRLFVSNLEEIKWIYEVLNLEWINKTKYWLIKYTSVQGGARWCPEI